MIGLGLMLACVINVMILGAEVALTRWRCFCPRIWLTNTASTMWEKSKDFIQSLHLVSFPIWNTSPQKTCRSVHTPTWKVGRRSRCSVTHHTSWFGGAGGRALYYDGNRCLKSNNQSQKTVPQWRSSLALTFCLHWLAASNAMLSTLLVWYFYF